MRVSGRLYIPAAFVLSIASAAVAAPDEDVLGKAQGYPVGSPKTWLYDEKVRVGSFSAVHRVVKQHTLTKPPSASPLPRAATEPVIRYRFDNQDATIDGFLARQRVMSLLVIKDGQILVERYQYDRIAEHRFMSHSMAKSITALAVGYALAEGRIKSLDDTVETYAKKLAGTAYGRARIRDILRMASGVPFTEVYDGNDDNFRYSLLRSQKGLIGALRAFGDRTAVAPGTRFHYASIETQVLGALVQAVTGETLSRYMTTRLWQPLGAEADAAWNIVDVDNFESASGGFNAVLRDYGRLGMLLANDGMRDGRQIIPRDFLLEATDWRRHPEAFQPRKATPYFGYGYQFWIYPGDKRRFALLGVYGQSMFVDPGTKLVMVVTAANKTASADGTTLARERDALWRGLVTMYGGW